MKREIRWETDVHRPVAKPTAPAPRPIEPACGIRLVNACLFIVAAFILHSALLAADVPKSVLGMEPGARRLCNDDVGVIFWGPDTAPTLTVGKSDVWDRRKAIPIEPVLSMDQMMAMARAGDPNLIDGKGYYTAYGSYDFPCPKPVGQLVFQLNFMGDDGTLTVDCDGIRSIRLQASMEGKGVDLRLFVSAARNLIAISGRATRLAKGDFAIRLYRHRDTILPGGKLNPTLGNGHSRQDFEQLAMPTAGGDEEVFWIAQDFPADLTFPRGFTSLLAARVIGAPVRLETELDRNDLGTPMLAPKEGRISHGIYKRYSPINDATGAAVTATFGPLDGSFQLLAAAVSTQDDANPLERARRDLARAVELGEPALWNEHVRQLDAYEARPHARAWSKDGKTIIDRVWGGVPYRIRPAGYYGDVPLCTVGTTKFCAQDSMIWHGDFHFNEIEATSYCIARQFELLDSYFKMIHQMLPMAEANARQVYACRGAMYPLMHYPLRAETVIHSHVTWEQSMEITALLTKPLWLHFLYTWDTEYLRRLAYPVLRQGARFYADFLKPSDDGLYHVFPTVSPEHRGLTKNLAYNRDSQSGITLIRYHLRAASIAARLIGVDADEAARWLAIAEQMPDYPTVETKEGTIFIDVAGAQPVEYNIAVPLAAVFWGDDIGLDSPPEQLSLARRTLELIDVWPPHQGYLRTVRRRLGIYDPKDGMTVENFIQSHTGVIRIFPAVPKGFEGGFENLGAQGAFVAAAVRDQSGVRTITLQSLAGNRCRLAKPGGDRSWRVRDTNDNKEVVVEFDGKTLDFDTRTGHTYQVECDTDGRLAE